jgi:hypothetical protein
VSAAPVEQVEHVLAELFAVWIFDGHLVFFLLAFTSSA